MGPFFCGVTRMKVMGLARLEPLQTDAGLRGAAAAFAAELRALSGVRMEDVRRRYPLARCDGCRLAIPFAPAHIVEVAFNVERGMVLIERVHSTAGWVPARTSR